jgi:hypothetical protein
MVRAKMVSIRETAIEPDRNPVVTSVIIRSLTKFYKTGTNLDSLVHVLSSGVSLRDIESFITRYSKDNRVAYALPSSDGETRAFYVYDSYRLHVKNSRKECFDVFCRGRRVRMVLENGGFIDTTIGQLNLIKWMIHNKVYDRIVAHVQSQASASTPLPPQPPKEKKQARTDVSANTTNTANTNKRRTSVCAVVSKDEKTMHVSIIPA